MARRLQSSDPRVCPKRSALPQVASTPVISPQARSDAPARAPGQSEPLGTFGEMLDASSATPDGAANQSTPVPPAQDDAPAAAVQSANALIVPLTIDLALLAPKLSIDDSASDPVPTKGKDDVGLTANGDATADDANAEAKSDTASVTPGPIVAEASPAAVIAPANAPIPAEAEAAAIAPKAASTATIPTSAPAEGPAPVVVVDTPPASADADSTNPNGMHAETVPAGGTEAPDGPAQAETIASAGQSETTFSRRPITQTESEETEDKSGKPAIVRPAYAEAGSSTWTITEPGDRKAEDKDARFRRTEAHPTDAGKPVLAQPSTDTQDPPEQAVSPETKPTALQPHAQPSEHASATARAAVSAANSDLPAPTSVAQAVTSQIASAPPLLGLNSPLASPLQAFWQTASHRAEPMDNAVAISGLAVEIVSRAHEGLRRFEIRLDPPELGRIDVRLDVDRSGNVTSRLTVERAETLDLLRRDAPQLERALQHAGLNTEGGLQFSLRDQNFAHREQLQQDAATLIVPDDEPVATEAARRGYGRLIGLGAGVDIRV